jgi:hypothetical protein
MEKSHSKANEQLLSNVQVLYPAEVQVYESYWYAIVGHVPHNTAVSACRIHQLLPLKKVGT